MFLFMMDPLCKVFFLAESHFGQNPLGSILLGQKSYFGPITVETISFGIISLGKNSHAGFLSPCNEGH